MMEAPESALAAFLFPATAEYVVTAVVTVDEVAPYTVIA